MNNERELSAVRVNMQSIEAARPNTFAVQRVLKDSDVIYEYQIGGSWTTDKPKQRPEGKRVVFDEVNDFRAARDAYFAWIDINNLRTANRVQDKLLEKPERPDTILSRILQARKIAEPLVLFVPWGVRPTGPFGQSERTVLDALESTQNILNQRNIPTEILLMPADLYATVVNNQVDSQTASAYFEQVSTEAEKRGFSVKPWSEIRDQNWTEYSDRATELTEEKIREILSQQKMDEAIKAANRRSGYTQTDDIQRAALAYLRERICEAEIVESKYKPIKLSVVPKNKDNEVDRELPRMYLIPPALQLPWLK